MTSPLLETKLYIPRSRRGLVPRPRLSERLNRGVEAKLTLVSAPAGFGKTTLLAEWLGAAPAEEPCLFGTGGRSAGGAAIRTYVLCRQTGVRKGCGASVVDET